MTRKEYLAPYISEADSARRHREYYAQFVNERTIAYVVHTIGKDKLLASKDPHMNDIPLRRWDNMAGSLPLAIKAETVGDYVTLSTIVCVAKEAAKQWVESQAIA